MHTIIFSKAKVLFFSVSSLTYSVRQTFQSHKFLHNSYHLALDPGPLKSHADRCTVSGRFRHTNRLVVVESILRFVLLALRESCFT